MGCSDAKVGTPMQGDHGSKAVVRTLAWSHATMQPIVKATTNLEYLCHRLSGYFAQRQRNTKRMLLVGQFAS